MKRTVSSLIVTIVVFAAAYAACRHPAKPQRQGFSGSVLTSGGVGGLAFVTTNSPGLLAGSGSAGSPLTATLTVSSPVSGTGSSGSPLTSSGDISAVTAGSGLSGGASSGAATVAVGAGSGILAAGAVTAVNLGAGLTFSSGAIIPNLTGGTCTAGQVVTAVSAAGVATCSYVTPNNYAGTHLEWWDEFVNFTCATTQTCGVFLTSVNGAGAAIPTDDAGTTTRPGLLSPTLGTTTTGRVSLHTANSFLYFGSYASSLFEATLGVTTLSTSAEEYAVLVGFHDRGQTANVNAANGCYFVYDRGNVATNNNNTTNLDKWECACSNASSRTFFVMDGTVVSDGSFTTVNAPVAALTLPDTNMYTLRVVVTSNTLAEFFVNGVKSCQITTNIPSVNTRRAGWGFHFLKSAGTTARTFSIDRYRAAIDFTTARSP